MTSNQRRNKRRRLQSIQNEWVFIDGVLSHRVIDTKDIQAQKEGKNTPNSNKRRLKLASDYNETEFNVLFNKG